MHKVSVTKCSIRIAKAGAHVVGIKGHFNPCHPPPPRPRTRLVAQQIRFIAHQIGFVASLVPDRRDPPVAGGQRAGGVRAEGQDDPDGGEGGRQRRQGAQGRGGQQRSIRRSKRPARSRWSASAASLPPSARLDLRLSTNRICSSRLETKLCDLLVQQVGRGEGDGEGDGAGDGDGDWCAGGCGAAAGPGQGRCGAAPGRDGGALFWPRRPACRPSAGWARPRPRTRSWPSSTT